MMSLSGIRAALVAGAFLAAGVPGVGASEPVELITVEEARLPPAESDGADRNITRGPGIDAVAPTALGVTGTFRFAVRFKPRNGVEIDPADVRVTYLREPFIDLTARLKDFISADGIDAPAVIVPPGEHVLAIEAVDKEGRTGRGEVTLTVNP